MNVPYATAYRALSQMAHAKPGETVLLHGASGGSALPPCNSLEPRE